MTGEPSVQEQTEDGLAFRVYDLATGDDDARLCRDIPEEQCREQPRSFLCHVAAQALSKTGDVLADSKVVLPWVLGSVGAPAFFIGLLVPIRESLALLPQILIGGFIRRFAVRKGFWIASSLVEGLCIILVGLVAFMGLRGASAGWSIIVLITVFSLARGVASIAAKDTLGKTVSKGRRGRISGYAASLSGLVALAVGAYLAISPQGEPSDRLLYAIVVAAGLCWFAAAASFALINEYAGATDGGRSLGDLVLDQVRLLMSDEELRKFLVARALMISTALVGPLYVTIAQRETGQSLDSLGWLMIASGLASALSSAFWGALSDRSSRLAMAMAAAMAGLLGVAVVFALAFAPSWTGYIGFYAAVLFVLGLAHSGVRIGRKTHVVDLASGDRKAEYVALGNTIIGLLLIVFGAVLGGIMAFSLLAGVAVLSLMALCGAAAALTMRHVQE